MKRYDPNKRRLRIVRDLNGEYKVVEERGKNRSIKIHANNIKDRDIAVRRMNNLKKELGIV